MANTTTYKGNEGNKGGMPGKEEVKGMAQNAMDTASTMASNAASAVRDKAKDVASTIGEKAKDFASGFGDRAESAVSSVGQGIQSVGDSLRDKGPHDGFMGKANSAISSALHEGGHYLDEQGLGGMADDITKMIRRNPLPAVLLGVGLGFMLARMSSRS